MKKRLVSILLALCLCAALLPTFAAAEDAQISLDQKNCVDTFKITQTYKFGETEKTDDFIEHDYAANDGDVTLKYTSTFSLSEEMAKFLCAHRNQLYDGHFTLNIKLDLDKLEWVTNETGMVMFYFESAFLKPVYPEYVELDERGENVNFSISDPVNDSGTGRRYKTEISIRKDYLLSIWDKESQTLSLPVELIAWDNENHSNPYTYSEMLQPFGKYTFVELLENGKFYPNQMMYADFSIQDWMKPMELYTGSAYLKVSEATRESVTTGTKVDIVSSLSVSGSFSYITDDKIDTASELLKLLKKETDDQIYHETRTVDEWKSNEVTLRLHNGEYVDDTPEEPEKPAEDNTNGLLGLLAGLLSGMPEMPFTDVSSGDYFYDAVSWAYGSGITGGTDETHFSPDAGCTRAQAVTFLWRALGCPAASYPSSFADVSRNAYYASAVDWAVSSGVTKGTGAAAFSPDAPCSRGEIVTLLCRALGGGAAEAAPFADVPAGAYYADAVAWAYGKNITGGTDEAHFSPAAPCTRAQIVTFLYRALGR